MDRQPILCVSRLTCTQTMRKDDFILKDIEFTVAPESLTVITGQVGSGKSVLLAAIAGEISNIKGTITRTGTIAYVPQIAWVFSGTIRENILFGEPYDETRYTRIIKACALMDDIQHFPNLDQTVVGERGNVLSGGQRARVSLARALYADAELYVLDDPLSSVDLKVGEHIFDECIKGLLGRKTRVITSHQEQFMKEADETIVLFKGRVLGKGPFNELKGKGALNTTVDPLYKKDKNEAESDDNFVCENGENDEVADVCSETFTQSKEANGLLMPDEDRTIGVVPSHLYWHYFKNGLHPIVIFALICLLLVSQGRVK